MQGLNHTSWRRTRTLIGAGAAVAALAVSAAPASAAPARHGDIVHGHKIGVKRAGQRAVYYGHKIGVERGWQPAPHYGHKRLLHDPCGLAASPRPEDYDRREAGP
jgi:hypothetical protein